MQEPRILIVDDEERIRSLVASYLKADGFEVVEANNGRDAVAEVERHKPDLVIMDVRMPGMDGFEALSEIRRTSDVYVIMLTARAEETDRIVGLSVGADDYVTKPFSPRELVARVKAVLRRARSGQSTSEDRLEFDVVTIDLGRREVFRNGELTDLTALQFDLLATLAESAGRVFSRGSSSNAYGDGTSTATSVSSMCTSVTFEERSATKPAIQKWSAPCAASATNSWRRLHETLHTQVFPNQVNPVRSAL